MAKSKAARKASTLSFAEALALLAREYPEQLAKQKLVHALAASKVGCKYEGAMENPQAFWSWLSELPPFTWDGDVIINWKEGAHQYVAGGQIRTMYCYALVRADVERLLPVSPKPTREPVPERRRKLKREPKPGRGRKLSPIWDDVFRHFDAVAKGKRFPSQGSAVEQVRNWLESQDKGLSESAIKRGLKRHRPWWWGA